MKLFHFAVVAMMAAHCFGQTEVTSATRGPISEDSERQARIREHQARIDAILKERRNRVALGDNPLTGPLVQAGQAFAPARALKAGDAAPEFQIVKLINAPDGTTATLEALRGKVVVLEFWATWCGPCVSSIPHMNELTEKLAAEDAVFLSVTKEEEATVAQFLKRKPIKGWVGLAATSQMNIDYGVQGIPYTVIIDKDGKIAGVTRPWQLKEEHLRAALAGKPLPKELRALLPSTQISTASPIADPAPEGLVLKLSISETTTPGFSATHIGHSTFSIRAPLQHIIAQVHAKLSSRVEIEEHLGKKVYEVTFEMPKMERSWTPREHQHKLLRDALGLALHLEITTTTRELDVYEMQIAESGLKMEETTSTGPYTTRSGHLYWQASHISLPSLATLLEGYVSKPVVLDPAIERKEQIMTPDGAKRMKMYEMSLSWEDNNGGIIRALEEQLGLKLVPARREMEIVVVRKKP